MLTGTVPKEVSKVSIGSYNQNNGRVSMKTPKKARDPELMKIGEFL
jgi:hypothetical protein